jgi:hypothetical protein
MKPGYWQWLGFAVGGLLFAGFAVLYIAVLPRIKPQAIVAAAYMARVACACYFIGGRTLASCMTDREAGMESVGISIDPTQRRVTGRVPLLASASATHTPGLGCVLDR